MSERTRCMYCENKVTKRGNYETCSEHANEQEIDSLVDRVEELEKTVAMLKEIIQKLMEKK